ncbi:MAG: hypothetical protein M3Y21_09340 [Candidatus Eremiobacteraeota bacterium]|nr:hypothetical protein [Candidatus Eremiobacteraeota bacterium]
MSSRSPVENADTINLIYALLVRFPEIASVRSMPGEGTLRFSLVLSGRLDRASQRRVTSAVEEHVEGLLELIGERPTQIGVEFETDKTMTFVHLTRDLETFSKDELLMLAGLFSQQFGDALVRNPVPDEQLDDDPAAQDEMVEYAVESLRDPHQSKSLVGFREEKRVLVYFLKGQKKAKASRS